MVEVTLFFLSQLIEGSCHFIVYIDESYFLDLILRSICSCTVHNYCREQEAADRLSPLERVALRWVCLNSILMKFI